MLSRHGNENAGVAGDDGRRPRGVRLQQPVQFCSAHDETDPAIGDPAAAHTDANDDAFAYRDSITARRDSRIDPTGVRHLRLT